MADATYQRAQFGKLHTGFTCKRLAEGRWLFVSGDFTARVTACCQHRARAQGIAALSLHEARTTPVHLDRAMACVTLEALTALQAVSHTCLDNTHESTAVAQLRGDLQSIDETIERIRAAFPSLK